MEGAILSRKGVDWEGLWSREARRKQMPTLQGIVSKYQGIPNVIGMHGGLPPSDAFPFTTFQCLLESNSSGSSSHASSAPAAVAAVEGSDVLHISDPTLVAAAQQYNMHAKGYPPLQAWAKEFLCELHTPATLHTSIGFEVAISPGSSAALDAIARVLLNAGDAVLVEEYTYNHHAEAHLLPLGCELVPVKMDEQGLLPSHLDQILTERQAAGLTMPRVLYTIPTGQNPTGACMSQERMEQVYALAVKWELVIIEDDAYYWLQYPDGPDNVPGLNLRPGFLSMDVDGRVVRIDTLAKLLGPGFRLGWVAGAPAVVNKVALYLAAVSVGAASLSQVMIHQLLVKWGRPGLANFITQLQRRYAQQAAVANTAAQQHLSELAEWQPVKAGMFMWMKIKGDGADASLLMDCGAAEGVMVVAGALSSAAHLQAAAQAKLQQQQQQQQQGEGVGLHQVAEMQQQQQQQQQQQLEPCPYFRVSFASVGSDEAIVEGFARLRSAILRCRPGDKVPAAAAAAAAATAQ